MANLLACNRYVCLLIYRHITCKHLLKQIPLFSIYLFVYYSLLLEHYSSSSFIFCSGKCLKPLGMNLLSININYIYNEMIITFIMINIIYVIWYSLSKKNLILHCVQGETNVVCIYLISPLRKEKYMSWCVSFWPWIWRNLNLITMLTCSMNLIILYEILCISNSPFLKCLDLHFYLGFNYAVKVWAPQGQKSCLILPYPKLL